MTNIYQGDPNLNLDSDGSYMVFRGGQPVMDGGWENAIYISLFTRKGFSGNILIKNDFQKVGSDFEKIANQTITIKSLNEIQNAGFLALRWMLDIKIASDIVVRARNPSGNRIEVLFAINPPSQETLFFTAAKTGINWQIQKLDPAHERM